MSQTNIKETYFLENCINKKRTVQDIYEALALYSETTDTRKEPVFVVAEANDLHRRIKEHAENIKGVYRNEREAMLSDLVKDDMFANEVEELGEQYGQTLWSCTKKIRPTLYGRQQTEVPDELNWDKESDRDTIRYYLRCWITRYAVQTPIPRKGKARANTAAPRELSDSEQSDLEHAVPGLAPSSAAQPMLPFRAPEAPGMLPPADSRADTVITQARLLDETVQDVAHRSEARSPVTPNKRKAMSFQRPLSSGKLQKVIRDERATTGSPQGRRQDIYDLPMSPPPPQFPVHLSGLIQRDRSHRETTCDTDRTWAPEPPREVNAGSETEIDPDEVMTDTQELLSDIQIASDREKSQTIRSPTVGPSGTYRNPQRQDSVIPSSTQQSATHPGGGQASDQPHTGFQTNSELWRSALMSTLHVDISKIDHWQEKQLRMELFKLLLSYLNYINQFSPDAYESEVEEQMNNLLYQFWINDADSLGSKTGDRFPVLQAALERWMNMRHLLSEFQRTSGYFGRPGDDWKAHLKRMDRIVDRAKANIAFVELKSFANMVGSAGVEKETFDDDLMTVFDSLTQVEGSNGTEAFEALRLFNGGLLEWFS